MNAAKQTKRRIVLTGFMGTGKTTTAAALARQLDLPALDLDALIAAREGRGINQIIEGDGEAEFRRMETEALRDALEENGPSVLALGGGAWTIERNRVLIAKYRGFVVWLDAPFELCWKRIAEGSDVVRPLAVSRAQAQKLYDARQAFYKLAALRVRVDEGRSAEDLADEIMTVLGAVKTEG